MKDERIDGIMESWAEETNYHNQYLIFEVGKEQSRLSVVDLSLREELYSASMPTPKYHRTNEPIKSEQIADGLLSKLILQDAA